MKGTRGPLVLCHMLKAETLQKALEGPVKERGCFIVELTVSRDNDVVLTVEKDEGSVEMDDCAALSDAFHALFDQEAEDYSLTVSSAGLDQPFKTERQLRKAVGTEVEVLLKGGRKLTGRLTAFDPAAGITLLHRVRESVEGSKKKQTVEREECFPLSETNAVRPHVEFD